MDISEIRKQNMLTLMSNFRTQVDFADAINKPASYISQLKKGLKPNGEKVGMGSDFARDIETSLNLDFGWMDVLHHGKQENDDMGEHIVIGQATSYPLVKIEYLDICASCGSGYVNSDYPEAFTQSFTVEFLSNNGLPTDGKGLTLMHACGDSMGHTIPHGTLMLVNKKENDFDKLVNNKIYVFNNNGEMICKRILKNLDGSLILRSDNYDKSTYPDVKITRESFENISLFGRVRYVFMQM